MADTPTSEHAPFHPDGPLCTLLDDADLLFKVYAIDPDTLDGIKRMMKKMVKMAPGQILRKDDPRQMGEAIRSFLNNGRRRNELAVKDPDGSTSLHIALYQWLLTRHKDFVESVTKESDADTDGDRVFFRPPHLEAYLDKEGVPKDEEQRQVLALLAAAFALFEPENAPEMVGLLAARGEPFVTWFNVSGVAV